VELRSSAPADALVELRGVTKRFGEVTAVDDVSFTIGRGEFFALLGPSGCGKTTLMRMLAGFEAPNEGEIFIDGADMRDRPAHKRPVNMMFQSYALFPHLTVERNVGFGLVEMGLPRDEIAARVAELLRLVRLEGMGARKPDQLSGGQKQRVALARALARRPKLLLLDEPLGALDRRLREETRTELIEVRRALGATFVMVTHDQEEAMSMADRIAVMRAGKVEQLAEPAEIYERPATRFVADFVGDINLISARLAQREPAGAVFETPDGLLRAAETPTEWGVGRAATLAVRPEHVDVAPDGEGIDAEVVDAAYLGGRTQLKLKTASGAVWEAETRGAAAPWARGRRVKLAVAPRFVTPLPDAPA
jgi:putrescine transport system ATP-binding protein